MTNKPLTGHAISFSNKLKIERIDEHMYDRHRYWFFWYGKTSRAKALAVVRALRNKPSRMPVVTSRYEVLQNPFQKELWFVDDKEMQITVINNTNFAAATRIAIELNKLNHGRD